MIDDMLVIVYIEFDFVLFGEVFFMDSNYLFGVCSDGLLVV